MRLVTAAEMQTMDRKTIEEIGIPGQVLMENAGRGATRVFMERLYLKQPGRVGVMAGRGNNGGDGFVMARYLAQRGIDVTVFLLASRDRVRGDAAINLDLLTPLKVPVIELPDETAFSAQSTRMRHIDYWIDAILGTGLNADVTGYFKTAIEFLNSLQRPVFAVDIPSGLNSDTGQPCDTCIRAAATATFGYAKLGHLIEPGAELCGPVDVIDIGIPATVSEQVAAGQTLVTGTHVRSVLPSRTADSHKGQTGHLLVVAGSMGKTGAAAMTAMAALRVGAGLVTLGTGRSINPILENMLVEAMTVPLPDDAKGALTETCWDEISKTMSGKRCLALGPGLGDDPETGKLVRRLIKECSLPMVIDADGLNHLSADLTVLRRRRAPAVLTPHPGEMARLTGKGTREIQQDRVTAVRDLARKHEVWVVLKGARTLIGEPDGRVWLNPTGNAGMAAGGMGDVLTGAVAGLLTQGASPIDAAVAAVFLHGLAGDILAQRTHVGFVATEVMDALPSALEQVSNDPPAVPVGGPWL